MHQKSNNPPASSPSSSRSTILRQARPVILITLINKIGSIGLSLIPVLLVDRHTTTAEASWVMGSIRITLILGTLSSGWFVDRIGAKLTILIALLLSAVGLGVLPFVPTAILIAVFGILAQYGDGLMRIAFRVLLTDTVPFEHHKEALGWMRSANNLGQILSFSVGALAGVFGAVYLFVFDAMTSLAAFFYTLTLLSHSSKKKDPEAPPQRSSAVRGEHYAVFILCAAVFSGYTFFYEIFMSATAGRLELLYPGKGLRLFSASMVINTVFCTLLSVPASKFFKRPSRVFPLGVFFTFLASVFSVGFTHFLPFVYLGSLCITGAEVAMMSLTQFTLIRLTPNTRYGNVWYSSGLTLTQSGRILGAALAFPWFIQPSVQPAAFYLLAGVCGLMALLTFSVRRALDRAAMN